MRGGTGYMTLMRWAALAAMLSMPAAARAQDEDVSAQARKLAAANQRQEAITLLRTYLAAHAEDDDVRVTLGTILSWENAFDESRAMLQAVLTRHPNDSDARAALMNVELWTKHPAEAKRLAEGGLADAPNDDRFLLGRRDAIAALDLVRPWEASFGLNYDGFSDDRESWRETQVSIKRLTPAGAILGRVYQANRFGLTDSQFEVEMYPRFRRGTSGYLAAAAGKDDVLYPSYRYAADLYQSVGYGFEVSGGVRRLGFSTRTTIYQAALGKYVGNWLVSGKIFFVPVRTGPSSRSYQAAARRYFGADGTNYINLRYSRGLARDDIRNLNDFEVLTSDTFGADAYLVVRHTLVVLVGFSESRQDRFAQTSLHQHSLVTSLGWRF
jgi:YaiO family outer membrane protein